MNESTLSLIHRHLDGRADAAHEAALQTALRENPNVADQLVAIAEVEFGLRWQFQPLAGNVGSVEELWGRLRPRPAHLMDAAPEAVARGFGPSVTRRTRPRRQPWLAAAALVLVLWALAVLLPKWGSQPASRPELTPTTPTWKPVATPKLAQAPKPELESDPTLRERLASFFLEDWAAAGKTLGAALESLCAEAQRLNHLDDATISQLRVELADEPGAEAVWDRPTFGRYIGLSLESTLALLAAQAGAEVVFLAPTTLRVSAKNDAPTADKITSREYRLSSNFLNFGRNDPADHALAESENRPVLRQEWTIPDWLEFWGIPMTDNKLATWDESSATLIASVPERDHDVLTQLQLSETSSNSNTVSLTARLIEKHAPGEWLREETILPELNFQLWLRDLSQIRGTDLMTFPKLTLRSAQNAKTEITREVIPRPDVDPSSETGFYGTVIGFNSLLSGDCVRLETEVTLSRLPDAKGFTPLRDVKQEDLETLHTEVMALIPRGHTVLFSVGTTQAGRQVVAAITANMLRRDGSAIKPVNKDPHQ